MLTYVCMHIVNMICLHIGMHAHVCVHMWSPEIDSSVFPDYMKMLCIEVGYSHLSTDSVHSSSLPSLFTSSFPISATWVLGLQFNHYLCLAFMLVLGIWTLMLAPLTFYPQAPLLNPWFLKIWIFKAIYICVYIYCIGSHSDTQLLVLLFPPTKFPLSSCMCVPPYMFKINF